MKLLEKMALDWAERNSSPGVGGRDDLYEILIAVQKQAYEAGFLVARGKSEECAVVSSDGWYESGEQNAGIACSNVSWHIARIGEEEV